MPKTGRCIQKIAKISYWFNYQSKLFEPSRLPRGIIQNSFMFIGITQLSVANLLQNNENNLEVYQGGSDESFLSLEKPGNNVTENL